MQRIPVYVISLRTATLRRTLIEQHLKDLDIDFEFFDAVRGSELDPVRRASLNPSGNMSMGALGCYISHTSIYEQMIVQQQSVALILEDDAVLHRSVRDLVYSACEAWDFDYCFLGSDDVGDSGYVFYDKDSGVSLNDRHQAFRLSSGPYCTNAYLVSLEGAKKRLARAFPTSSPIDHYRHLPYEPRFFALIPMLAFVSEQSAIESMSSAGWSELQSRARKYWWYYPFRDFVKFRAVSKRMFKWRAKFPYNGRWRSFQSAFRVVRRSHLS